MSRRTVLEGKFMVTARSLSFVERDKSCKQTGWAGIAESCGLDAEDISRMISAAPPFRRLSRGH